MQLGDALNDGKPKACASWLAAITSPETLKDKFALVFSYARSVIENAHRAVLFNDKFHGCSRRGMVYRIFCQISDGTAQHFRIAFNPHRARRAQQGDVLALR